MDAKPAAGEKPTRLYFKTYLQVLRNSVGTAMFRSFYLRNPDGSEVDSMSDGSNSCAFFVSSVLTLFKKHTGVHGTVKSTVEDLQHSDWRHIEQDTMRAGDVVVWEAIKLEDDWHQHIGFYVGDGRAVSTSSTDKVVVEHDVHFDGKRAISQVFTHDNWDQQTST